MAPDDLPTREEVLAGLSGGRAHTLLFLIEARTAALVAHSREAVERFHTQAAGEERNLAFLEAFALGREPPLSPSIQDLERYAPQWAALTPENPRSRAGIAHLLGQKYRLPRQRVPAIRAALGLDSAAVRQAHQRQYGAALDSIYTSRLSVLDLLRWGWAALASRLAALPPFWTAFALTLTETVGAGILALPIALAAIGPLPGLAVLVVIGLVNQLTITATAESVARSGAVRYGNAFFGRLVADYLGPPASLVLSVSLAIQCFLGLMAYSVGIGTTLADATRVPAAVWSTLLFLVCLYVLSRGSLTTTVASALVIGALNIGLIVLISALTLGHLNAANFAYVNVPGIGGRPLEGSILSLVFGVVLLAYFGHLSVGSCARLVLRRDPSARSLILGSVAAQLATMLLYCLWVGAVTGAVAPQTLAGLSGTALAPLGAEVGPTVQVLGSLFAILAMGMSSIQKALGLVNLTRDWLPATSRTVLLLPRRRGTLVFEPRRVRGDAIRVMVTYLGLGDEGQPRVRVEVQVGAENRRVEFGLDRRWALAAALDRFPELRDRGVCLVLEVLDATQASVRLGIATSMRVCFEGGWDALGLHLAETLSLPDTEQQLVTWLLRHGEATLSDASAHTGQDRRLVHDRLTSLVERGYVGAVEVGGEPRYRARLGWRRGRTLPDTIWRALPADGGAPGPPRIRGSVLGERSRVALSLAPLCLVFVVSQWLLFTRTESFTGPLSFSGVIAATLVGGVFPVLMLTAARRKAELVPGLAFRLVGHPLVTTGAYALFVGNLFLHGLAIWSGALQRASALAVGLLVIGVTIASVRRGAFTRRAVVEVRDDQRSGATFGVTVEGEPTVARVTLRYADREHTCQAAAGEVPGPSGLREADFDLPRSRARELKVWVHQITREGESKPLPALVDISSVGQFDLRHLGEQVRAPLRDGGCSVKISLLHV